MVSLVVVHVTKALLKNKLKLCVGVVFFMVLGLILSVAFPRHYHASFQINLPYYQSKQGEIAPLTNDKYFMAELQRSLARDKGFAGLSRSFSVKEKSRTSLKLQYDSTFILAINTFFKEQSSRLSRQKPYLLGLAEKHNLHLNYSINQGEISPQIRIRFLLKWFILSLALSSCIILMMLFLRGKLFTD